MLTDKQHLAPPLCSSPPVLAAARCGLERWEILHLGEVSSTARRQRLVSSALSDMHRQKRRARAARWAVVDRVTAVTLISNTNSRRFLPFSETLGGFPKTIGWPNADKNSSLPQKRWVLVLSQNTLEGDHPHTPCYDPRDWISFLWPSAPLLVSHFDFSFDFLVGQWLFWFLPPTSQTVHKQVLGSCTGPCLLAQAVLVKAHVSAWTLLYTSRLTPAFVQEFGFAPTLDSVHSLGFVHTTSPKSPTAAPPAAKCVKKRLRPVAAHARGCSAAAAIVDHIVPQTLPPELQHERSATT